MITQKKRFWMNLKTACKKLAPNYEKLILLNQVHSNKFHFLNKNYKNYKKKLTGDALITNQKKI